jgi:hypothetical protein
VGAELRDPLQKLSVRTVISCLINVKIIEDLSDVGADLLDDDWSEREPSRDKAYSNHPTGN